MSKPAFVLTDNWNELRQINPRIGGPVSTDHVYTPRAFQPPILTKRPKASSDLSPSPALQPRLSLSRERFYLFPDIADYQFLEYASIYFQRQKTSFFRNSSVELLCNFSSKPLLHPLHMVDRMHIADALDFERSILVLQGTITDAKRGQGSPRWGLLTSGDVKQLSNVIGGLSRAPDLVDELFAYLIRQTTECSNAKAELKGFEALYVIARCCKPSDHLLPYLIAHLRRCCYADNEVGDMGWVHFRSLESPATL